MKRTFRLFLSSTFGDFQAEREALRSEVWPQLEAYCAARGASFEVVDLRWGISESDGLAHDTVRICLDEIAHCQKLSPKPNFLMLLGDRYGWRPLPPEIPAEEFEPLRDHQGTGDARDVSLLTDWYRRDDNAVPPSYVLRPRGEAHRSYAQWQPIEDQLLRILRTRAESLGITPWRREHYLYSATHQEIVRGALAIGDADQHIFACLRDLPDLDPQTPPARRFTDFDANGQVDAEAAQVRQELRSQVAACLPPKSRFHYLAHWQGRAEEPIGTAHLEPLCADILNALRRVIDKALDTATGDTLDQEIASHRAIGNDRARIFVGRTAQRAQLAHALQTIRTRSDETPEVPQSLLIHGPGGAGKSAFMAKALADIQQSHRDAHPETVVIERFIGTTPRSIDLATFLRDLLAELARRYGQDETLPEGDLKELIEALPERLAWATQEQPLILVIDALDQFTDSFHARQHQWLPRELPPHVALVLSVLDGLMVASLQQRHPQAKAIPLPAFTPAEGEAMLDALLAQGSDRQRRLTPTQKTMVLNAFKGDGRPLYLALAANACRRWRSWDEPTPLPDRLEALIRRFVDELKATHGPRIADRALDYLCAARFGVSDQEMRDLLWRDREARAEFDQRKNPDQPEVTSLPTVIWSRFYFDLAPYLAAQGTTGALLYRFYHRIIGEEIAAYTLVDDAQIVHSRIADYFASQPLHLGNGASKTPNLRKLTEEPWQRIKAEQLDKAEQLLTDFSFAMAKCEADQVNDLLQDYRALIEAHRQSENPISDTLRMWEAFFRERAHILRRGNAEWPAHKILLQLSVEHADNSPLTLGAEAWLAAGYCDWEWIRRIQRVDEVGINPCIAVLEGHTDGVDGVLERSDGTLVSWSRDHTLRLWSSEGAPLKVLEGHTEGVRSVLERSDGTLVSWSWLMEHTLRLWRKEGDPLKVLEGHTRWVVGVLERSDGTLVSWSSDNTLRLWSTEGESLKVLEGHTSEVVGVLERSDSTLVSWSRDHTLRLWSPAGDPLEVLEGHNEGVDGVLERSDGTLVSWSSDKTLRLWSPSGDPIKVIEGHPEGVRGVLERSDGTLVSWSLDNMLRLWRKEDDPLRVLEGHTSWVDGVLERSDGTLVSWSRDNTLRLWSPSGDPLKVLEGHTNGVDGVLERSDGTLVSWSQDHTLRLWSPAGDPLKVLEGHTGWVRRVLDRSDGTLVSCSMGKSLRLWNPAGVPIKQLEGHTGDVRGVLERSDGALVSWSDDHTLRLWSKEGRPLKVLKGHAGGVHRVLERSDGTLVSWSEDHRMRLWNKGGDPIKVLSANPLTVLSDGVPEQVYCFLDQPADPRRIHNYYLGAYGRAIRLGGDELLHRCIWHPENNSASPQLLYPNGRMVVTQSGGQVCFLQLYRRNQPINLKVSID